MRFVFLFFITIFNLHFSFAKENLIIDTDSAYFSDDLFSIAQIYQSNKFDVLGITVTSGNTHRLQGAQYVLSLLEVLSKETGVYIGKSSPIESKMDQLKKLKKEKRKFNRMSYLGYFTYAKLPYDASKVEYHLGHSVPKSKVKKLEASKFIYQSLKENKKKVTILALGPLTNIANAIKRDVSVVNKIKQIVIMGGAINVPGNTSVHAETNFWFDPEAAQFVLRAGIKKIVLIPLDLTNQAVLDYKAYNKLAKGGGKLRKMFKEQVGGSHSFSYPSFEKNPTKKIFFWDLVASSYLTNPSLFEGSETYYIDVNANLNEFQGKAIGYNKKLLTKKFLGRNWIQSYSEVIVPSSIKYRSFLNKLKLVLDTKE